MSVSASKVGGSSDQQVERDPRIVLRLQNLKHNIETADMSDEMQQKIVEITTNAYEKYVIVPTKAPYRQEEIKLLEREVERVCMREISYHIKKEVEKEYGPTWHVVYGRGFSNYVTYEQLCFVHFTFNGATVVVWKHGA